MNFNHFLITRFNLKFSDNRWKKDKSNNEILNKDWLMHRMEIFLKYCVPSVLKQSNKNFTWLLYLDINTDVEVVNKLANLTKQYGFIKTFYVSSYEKFSESYCTDCLNLADKKNEYIITSRLDNDDIIHKDFIKKVQASFQQQKFMAVNFLKILMLNPENYNNIHIDYQFSNHFISLIEKIKKEGIVGCYGKKDTYWNVKGEVIHIHDKPYCIETISDRNLINNFRGFPLLKKIKLNNFQLEGTYQKSLFNLDNTKLLNMSWKKYFQYLKLNFKK